MTTTDNNVLKIEAWKGDAPEGYGERFCIAANHALTHCGLPRFVPELSAIVADWTDLSRPVLSLTLKTGTEIRIPVDVPEDGAPDSLRARVDSHEQQGQRATSDHAFREPARVDWSQAPEWARFYAKDRDASPWDCIGRCTWREQEPLFSPSSPYGQWGGVSGEVAEAPDFTDSDDWGIAGR